MVDALNSLSEIHLSSHITGSVDKPTMTITSNLDDVVNKAISGAIKSKITSLKAEVSGKLRQSINEQLAPYAGSLKELEALFATTEDSKKVIDQLIGKIK